ncbi:uncharacterized protein LOC133466823 isoform X9 [Phyllopteryx taeniolatus]|uniref:uncharacterized protein LOC133466823 isoform X9 n=1 Tax=Phyllopteryx taeniolatus TaxID=161469 RepID=UPI002AD25A4F|nr:uncharacterized protein LOC133466823 isoform X9 [Phyllopteryx taeniolatus]
MHTNSCNFVRKGGPGQRVRRLRHVAQPSSQKSRQERFHLHADGSRRERPGKVDAYRQPVPGRPLQRPKDSRRRRAHPSDGQHGEAHGQHRGEGRQVEAERRRHAGLRRRRRQHAKLEASGGLRGAAVRSVLQGRERPRPQEHPRQPRALLPLLHLASRTRTATSGRGVLASLARQSQRGSRVGQSRQPDAGRGAPQEEQGPRGAASLRDQHLPVRRLRLGRRRRLQEARPAAQVESPAHSDFLLLRDMLVRTHMQDLKDVTRESHYENYRACCIRNMTRMVARDPERSLRAKCGEESDADVPLPLAAFDADKDRLTSEKDQERSSTWWSRRRAAAQHKAPFAIRRARKSAIGIASQSSSYTGLRNAEAEEEYSATGREPQKTKGLFAFCFLLLASFSVQRSKNGKSLCCFAFAQCAVTVIKRLGVFARTKAQKHKSMPLQPRSCQQQTCDVSHVCSQSKYVFFFPSSNCPDATKWQKALIELLDSRQRSSSAPGWRQSNTFIFDRALA